jgi:hypothetical protein
MRRSLPILCTVLALTACTDKANDKRAEQPAPPKAPTVLEFLESPQALEELWPKCRNDPGGLGTSPACVNAGYANERLMMLGRERAIQSLKR